MIVKIETLALAERLANDIRSMITQGTFKPGQKLSESALCEQFDVSRNSLREGFRLLTREGLLHHQANRGVFVSVPTSASIADIYRIRRIIECGALAKSWPQHSAVKRMREAVELAKQYTKHEDWLEVGSANMQFHVAVVDLADSSRLNNFYARISAEIRLGFGLLQDPEHLHAPFVELNANILSMVEVGEAERAAKAMDEYLVLSERTVLKAFEKIEPVRF